MSDFFMKKSLLFLVVLSFLAWPSFTVFAEGARLRVTADNVNLRSSPNNNAEVVAQVSAGDILISGEKQQDDWIEVMPPSRVDLWVYGEFVKDGVVAVSTLAVRCGPGINYGSLGSFSKGDKLNVRGTAGDWIKIAPPDTCRFWIYRKYIEPVDGVGKTETAVDDSNVVDAEIKESQSVPEPVPALPRNDKPVRDVPVDRKQDVTSLKGLLVNERLVLSMEQGKTVEYTGVLGMAGPVLHKPCKYRLVMRDDKGRVTSACYILGDPALLEKVMGHILKVQGREYWIRGVRDAVVEPSRIVRIN